MAVVIIIILASVLLYVLQARVFQKVWSKNLDVDIHFERPYAIEGEQANLIETITNAKWFPIPILHVKFQIHRNLKFLSMKNAQVSDKIYKSDMFSLFFYQRITRSLPFLCSKRGYYSITQADIVAYNMFFTGHMVSLQEQDTHFYVYPRPVSAAQLEIPYRRMMGLMTTKRFLYQDPFAFQGIRDYEIFDPLKTVNWKASARSGSLKTNTYEYTAGQQVCLLLNLEDEAILREEQLLETSISLTSSLAERFLSEGVPVSIYTNGRDLESKEPISLPSASGLSQIQQINQQLARLDLDLPVAVFPTLSEQIDAMHDELESACMIVISYCQRPETDTAVRKLADRYPGLLWLLPLYPENETLPASDQNVQVMKWEVEHLV